MKVVSAAQMRELDRRTIEDFGTPGELLMERAGQGVVDAIRRTTDYTGFVQPVVHVIAGRGNNGGDAFVVARVLHQMGIPVELWVAGPSNELKGDALKHFSKMTSAGVIFRELPTKDDWDAMLASPVPAEILVDGVLGTGAQGPARGPVAGAVQYINAQSADALVVSIDIPSGLHSDTGEPLVDAVRADITVTMGLPKQGLMTSAARDYVGTLEVVDIGIPEELVDEVECQGHAEFICPTDLRLLFPRRPRDSHKGRYGRVLVVGGAQGYVGAITMAARAAVRSGAGLVTALVPDSIVDIVSGASLETMVYAAPETGIGSLSVALWKEWRNRMDDYDAVLIGPGMTRDQDTLLLVREILRESQAPLVIDADALAVLQNQPDWINKAQCPVAITPHPGELGMLFGQEIELIQQHRVGMAEAAAKYTGATVVLKGAGTVVAAPGRPNAINLTGNPGMATGGSGDVLAGLLAGLVAQGLSPYDAACAAVYMHGRAGDLLAWRKSQAGLAASDLIEEIPYVYRDVTLR